MRKKVLQLRYVHCTHPRLHDSIEYKHVRNIFEMKNDTPNIQLQKALVPVSKMVIQFGLHCHEFKNNIQKAYVQAAIELLEEAQIKPTIQAIAVKTGLDRRAVSDILKNLHSSEKSMNKMDLLLDELQKKKEHSQNPISAATLNQIIDGIYGGHIRAKAVTRELIAQDVLRPQGKQYLINKALQAYLIEQRELADEVDITTKRLFDTFYQKMYGQNQAEHLNLASVYSSQIPDSKHNELNEIIEGKMQQFQSEMESLIRTYETKVKAGSFANVGFAQFQFDSRKPSKLGSETQ